MQVGDIKCPICGKKFTESDLEVEVKAIGKFNTNTHSNEYTENIIDNLFWFKTKCKGKDCKTIIAYRPIMTKNMVLTFLRRNTIILNNN